MRNILLTIQYDGKNYQGWQMQNEKSTVEKKVTEAVSSFIREDTKLYASGRTDAGVHALGQCANFKTEFECELKRFISGINAFLPEDIRIINAENMVEDFHSRYNAFYKEYIYVIYNSPVMNPLLNGRAAHVFYNLDFDKMKEASRLFIGEHDFKGFAGRNNDKKITVRNITDTYLEKVKDNVILFRIKGNGFLHNMVRIMTGTLIDIGRGKHGADVINEIYKTGNRELAKVTAPAHGLYLNKVCYDKKYYL